MRQSQKVCYDDDAMKWGRNQESKKSGAWHDTDEGGYFVYIEDCSDIGFFSIYHAMVRYDARIFG